VLGPLQELRQPRDRLQSVSPHHRLGTARRTGTGVGEGLRGEVQSKTEKPFASFTRKHCSSSTITHGAGNRRRLSITPFGLPVCHISFYRMNRSGFPLPP
jgi:hypothetical protein